MTIPITATYAAIFAVLMLVLTVPVLMARGRTHVSLGNGGDTGLHQAIRRHGNFTEYVPVALIVMALAEIGGMSAGWVHATGVMLLAARIVHPFGLVMDNPAHILRILGTTGTQIAVLIPVVFILRQTAGF